MAINLSKPVHTQPRASSPTRSSPNGRRAQSTAAPAFLAITTEVRNRVVVNIQGPEKSGKDHMALLYDAGPIYIHSFDLGLEGVVDKFVEGPKCLYGAREIYKAEYKLEVQPGEGVSEREVGEGAIILLDQFRSNLMDSYASTREDGLVLVDTGSEVWELVRLAYFGKLSQVPPHLYSKPNAEFRDMVRCGISEGNNVAWLHKMKDEYENVVDSKGQMKSNKTGAKKFSGMSDIPFLVQFNVQTFREDKAEGGSDFYAQIIDSRHYPELNNTWIENDIRELIALVTV